MSNNKKITSAYSDVKLYTDGSCNTQFKTGAWAAIIFINDQKKILQDVEHDTTHQRMELQGVIKSLKWLSRNHPDKSNVYLFTDSQYLINLPARKTKLINLHFTTSKSKAIRNADLVEEFYNILNSFQLQIEKVKAHEKKTDNQYDGNKEADRICRKAMRNALMPG